MEKAAIERIINLLPPEIGAEILQLYLQYENRSTPEAWFVYSSYESYYMIHII